MRQPFVSIVIPTLNDTEALARLPAALDVEVIIVNGGVPDARLAALVDRDRHRLCTRSWAATHGDVARSSARFSILVNVPHAGRIQKR